MRHSIILLLFLSTLLGCKDRNDESRTDIEVMDDYSKTLAIPDIIKEKTLLTYNTKNSIWSLENQVFSGYAVSYYPDSSLQEKFGILDGKKQNEYSIWYPDGNLKIQSEYHQGKLNGSKQTWSPDSTHILVSHLNYKGGKLHGVQKKWYPTGELFKVLNLENGREEGMQKAYRKNGVLYANYEAREGRVFGLKKAALCYGLDDEKIQYAK